MHILSLVRSSWGKRVPKSSEPPARARNEIKATMKIRKKPQLRFLPIFQTYSYGLFLLFFFISKSQNSSKWAGKLNYLGG